MGLFFTFRPLEINVLGHRSFGTHLKFVVPVGVVFGTLRKEREREMFYLTTHSTHFIYSYMASAQKVRYDLSTTQGGSFS